MDWDTKEYKKKYYLDNREYFLQYRKKHYEENKEYINRKITCEFCGRTVIFRMYKKHCLTNIHLRGTNTNVIHKPQEPPTIELKIKNDGWVKFK